MRVCEINLPGDRKNSGRWERLFILMALVGIVIWGFNGNWEYPTIESSAPLPTDHARISTPGGASGAELFRANGCNLCHSLEGGQKIGPSLNGIFGATVELTDGSTLVIDDAYLVESILEPEAKRVVGYEEAAMPSYEGIVSMEDAELLADYITGLE